MIQYMQSQTSANWLLLVISLPTSSATGRMRIWRALKALGCVALRDGAYLLPLGPGRAEALRELGDECEREGGSAWLMTVTPRSAADDTSYRQLFDRSEQYAEVRTSWKNESRGLRSLTMTELARLKRRLQKEFDALRSIDFFPSEASAEAEAAWGDLSKRIDTLLSPDEPHESADRISRLDVADYQGRTWATRRHLWVDRVASAWLIQRFIDRKPRFVWLDKPADCPRKALGFDFDGASFTHVGDRVTFEVLMASFGLEEDPALARLAALVHALDVGGEQVPEAAGFEAVLNGARERVANDDVLLADMSVVLDSLYMHFQNEGKPGNKGAAK
jgi:hypothetical protein